MANKQAILQQFQNAIKGQESGGGNYTAVNSDSGAGGAYQFLPSTWSAYAKQYGYGAYANMKPQNVPKAIQDAVFMKYAAGLYDTFNGDIRYMADAHYAGVGAAMKHYRSGSLPTASEGNYPSQASYANSIAERMGQANSGESSFFNNGVSKNFDYFTEGQYSQQQDPVVNHNTPSANPSFWEKLATGFMDTATNTESANLLQLFWGGLAHTNSVFGGMEPITQDDIDKVRAALPDDPDSQRYVLLNAKDKQERDWLINQRLVDRNRQAEIAQFNDGCVLTASNLGRLLGEFADPINYIPVAEGANAARIMARTGKTISNFSKVMHFASVGAQQAAIQLATDYTEDKLGIKQMTPKEYGWSAANAFLAGSILSGVGDAFSNFKLKKPVSEAMADAAERTETHAVKYAADLDRVKNETINDALKIHDTEFGKTINSPYYNRLEKNGRIVATTFEDARKLVSDAAGIDLPKETKSFYVPNEDYAFLIKDNVKPNEVDNILAHEFGVHAGLQKTIGDKAYNALMDDVSSLSNKEGHIFNEARKKADSYNPEEILAYAVENDMLPKGILSNIKGMVNKGLKREGISAKVTAEQVRGLLSQQADAVRDSKLGLHFNPDGSTAFAGIKYSKDNFLNPALFANFIQLEKPVTKATQSSLPTWFPKKIGRWLEQGTAGDSINSASNTVRRFANNLWDDPRGRGLGHVATISAETNKERITHLLSKPYIDYANVRQNWCLQNHAYGRSGQQAFDKLVTLAYNAKYAGSKANIPTDIPKEVWEAVEHLKAYRDLQIELGKRSAHDVGSPHDNLIEADWEPVDNELWRIADNDSRIKFLNNFKGSKDLSQYEEGVKFLENYYKAFAKRDVIKAKIERGIDKENAKITEYNEAIPEGSTRKPKKLIKKKVSEDDIDAWLDEHVPIAADHMLKGNLDATVKENINQLGNLPFLKERVPIDTTGVMVMPNGKEFSFDNNLRSYDMDSIVQKNMSRFAGESSIKNVFGSEQGLQDFLTRAKKELKLAYENGAINKGKAEAEYNALENGIYELRGMRPNAEAMQRLGALGRIFRNLAYAKNGANMGFAQLGELGGTIAYGGASQLAHVFKPLGKFVDDCRWGKVSSNTIKDAEEYIFGSNIESQIFSMNWGDRAMRDALTEKNSILNKTLTMAGDFSANLGKLTSTLNMLPKMTDSMVRGMRTQTIMDSLEWAYGKSFSKVRNPFSDAKLKASHISPADAKRIKDNIVKFTKKEDGQFTSFDFKSWQNEDPESFMKWYGLVQTQTERGIVSGTRLGNKNLLKDKNAITQMMFQFKDYNLRSINSQSMRAMTARDLDDAMATSLSIVTNIASYAARAGAYIAALKAVGADKKAEEYADTMFDKGNLTRAAAFRSTILGSPLSVFNDFYEGATGAPSIRTTVDRGTGNKGIRTDNVGDALGNIVSQMPAVKEAEAPVDVLRYFYNASNNEANKRDFKKALQALPVPNLIPFSAYISNYIDQSDYPDKRPKK